MKKHFIALGIGLLAIAGFVFYQQLDALGATPIIQVYQGGTGSSTLGGILMGGTSATSSLRSVTIGSNLTLTGTTLSSTGGSSGSGIGNVSTSTNETKGRLSYWTSNSATPALLGEVATSSITINAPLTSAGTAGYVVGGSGWTLDVATTTNSLFTGTAGQVLAYLNDGWTGVATTTFSSGLTYSAGNVTADLGTSIDISSETNLAGDTEIVLTGDALSIASTIARDTELPVGANPTGTIGLTAVNGTALTFLRSDGAPVLSQSITPTWTGLHIFNTGGFISNASSSAGYFNSASSTIDVLAIPSLTSALMLTNANGLFAEYAGTSCTNQFVRSLSALGAATCATVGTADVSGLDISDDTNLATTWPVILTGDTLSWGGLSTSTTPTAGHLAYWSNASQLNSVATGTISATSPLSVTASRYAIGGATAFSWDFSIANIWTGFQTFADGIFTGSLGIATGTAPTVDAIGEIALDTTDNQLLLATSTDANWPGVIRTNQKLFSFKVASTSMAYASTSMVFPPEKDGFTVTSVSCRVEGGTSVALVLTDANGTNDSNSITCNTANANYAITANYTWTAGEEMKVEWGTKTGAIDWVNVSVFGVWTRE